VRFLLTGAKVERLIRSEEHLKEFEFSSQDFLWIFTGSAKVEGAVRPRPDRRRD
jgi:hypothetical protein